MTDLTKPRGPQGGPDDIQAQTDPALAEQINTYIQAAVGTPAQSAAPAAPPAAAPAEPAAPAAPAQPAPAE